MFDLADGEEPLYDDLVPCHQAEHVNGGAYRLSPPRVALPQVRRGAAKVKGFWYRNYDIGYLTLYYIALAYRKRVGGKGGMCPPPTFQSGGQRYVCAPPPLSDPEFRDVPPPPPHFVTFLRRCNCIACIVVEKQPCGVASLQGGNQCIRSNARFRTLG